MSRMMRDALAVLVVEPNLLLCDLIRLTLLRNEMQPIICEDPGGLSQALVQHIPDVLLIDTHLRGLNGLDLVAQLDSKVLLRRTRVFFLSALGFPEIVQRAAQLGASGFLVKPLDPDLLVRRIRSACASRHGTWPAVERP